MGYPMLSYALGPIEGDLLQTAKRNLRSEGRQIAANLFDGLIVNVLADDAEQFAQAAAHLSAEARTAFRRKTNVPGGNSGQPFEPRGYTSFGFLTTAAFSGGSFATGRSQ